MKKTVKSLVAVIISAFLAIGFSACGSKGGDTEKTTPEVAGDYYIDLSSLGMNLTVYLRLSEYGEFIFSGSLEFSVDKGSGVFNKSGDEYLMSYTVVNGASVTAADGYMSQFKVIENGVIYFTSDCIYYGSTHPSTTSDDDPDAHLIAVPVGSDFEEPDTESEFTEGVYSAGYEADGITYNHYASFFGDGTYLHFVWFNTDDGLKFASETGTYSVVTTQLALVPSNNTAERNSCTVVSGTELTLSVLVTPEAEARENVNFIKVTDSAAVIAVLEGEVESYPATLTLYADGSYEAEAESVKDAGVITMDTAAGTFKQYPDSPVDGTRGLTKVDSVHAGVLILENGKIRLENARLRISESSYTRYSCTLTETTEG